MFLVSCMSFLSEAQENAQTVSELRPLLAQNPSRPHYVQGQQQPSPSRCAEIDAVHENRYQSPNVHKRKIGPRPSHSTEPDLQHQHDYPSLPNPPGQNATHRRVSSKPAPSASTKSPVQFDLRETSLYESPAEETHYLENSPLTGMPKRKGKDR